MPKKTKAGQKKSDNKDANDAMEAEQAVDKTTGYECLRDARTGISAKNDSASSALGALNNRTLPKDPPPIGTHKSTLHMKAVTPVDPGSPLTTNPPSPAPPPLPTIHESDTGADKDGEMNDDEEGESGDGMKDGGRMEAVQQPEDCKYTSVPLCIN